LFHKKEHDGGDKKKCGFTPKFDEGKGYLFLTKFHKDGTRKGTQIYIPHKKFFIDLEVRTEKMFITEFARSGF